MKKIISVTILALSALGGLQAQTTQAVRWANQMGGNSTISLTRKEDAVKAIVEDANSNTYVIGNYTGTATFDVWSSVTTTGYHSGTHSNTNLVSYGDQDVFLARYDVDGYCTWAVHIGGTGFDEGNAITIPDPATPSSFYITGTFTNSMTIGTNTLTVTSNSYTSSATMDAFIIRYNTGFNTFTGYPTPPSSATTPSWWRSLGGYEEACGMGIVTSGTNVFVTGYFNEYCIDSGDNLILQKTHTNGTTGTTFSTSTPGYQEFPYHDMFVARYSTSGTFSDVLNTLGGEDEIEGHGIAVYGSDLYVIGTWKNSAKFVSSTLTCSGHSDIFVAKYPQSFSTPTDASLAASAAVVAGGSSTVYQAAVEEPFYKQDEGYAICATSSGIFVTGRFMDQATFGAAGTFNPSGSSTETYMFLARYDANLTATPIVITGTSGYSEGRSIYGIDANPGDICVAGGTVSNGAVNSTSVETNGYVYENVGFVGKFVYASSAFTNSFVDGIAQNTNGLNGTGLNDISVVGFGVSARSSCEVRVGGRFSSKTTFGAIEKTCSGIHDGFLLVRENNLSLTASTFNCGSGSIVLTASPAGTTTSPAWTAPPSTVISTTLTATVSPTVTTTYTFSATAGGCAISSPVTVFNFPASTLVDAGPNKSICGATHTVLIGTVAQPGYTYSWAPAGNIVGGFTTLAQPTATVSATNTTFTLTVTDKCGNISTDNVNVHYDAICPRRLNGHGEEETASLLISPNPNNGTFSVSTASDEAKDIFVYDMMGKLVYSRSQVSGTNVLIDIGAQPAGIYLVKVVTGDVIETQRVMKQ